MAAGKFFLFRLSYLEQQLPEQDSVDSTFAVSIAEFSLVAPVQQSQPIPPQQTPPAQSSQHVPLQSDLAISQAVSEQLDIDLQQFLETSQVNPPEKVV